MAITNVWIEPGCIVCALSVDTCPAVFEIPDGAGTARVREGVDVAAHAAEVRRAAEGCPVQVIQYEEE